MDKPEPKGASEWDPELEFRRPAPIVTLPASREIGQRGNRVVVGLPGFGWRRDLRADAPTVQGSRTYIPVLSEQEWYRAEFEQIEVFAPLIPVDRVWIELISRDNPGSSDISLHSTAKLDRPALRSPTLASLATNITGSRVVEIEPTTFTVIEHRDLRAVTEVYSNAAGVPCVKVCSEADWYRWAWSGRLPRVREVEASLVWLE